MAKPFISNVNVGSRGVYVGGNVEGSTITTGDSTVQQDASIEELRSLLAELREGVRASMLDDDTKADLEAEAAGVERQIGREAPNSSLLLGKIETVLNVLLQASAAGEKLVPMARRLGEVAAPPPRGRGRLRTVRRTRRHRPRRRGAAGLRIVRGGGFHDGKRYVRCASRNWITPGLLNAGLGFRVVLSLAISRQS